MGSTQADRLTGRTQAGREAGWVDLKEVPPSPDNGARNVAIESSYFARTLRKLARRHDVHIDLRVAPSTGAGEQLDLRPVAQTWAATPSPFLGRAATGSALVVVSEAMALA